MKGDQFDYISVFLVQDSDPQLVYEVQLLVKGLPSVFHCEVSHEGF